MGAARRNRPFFHHGRPDSIFEDEAEETCAILLLCGGNRHGQFSQVRFCRRESCVRKARAKRESKSKPEKSVLGPPVSISKHSSTRISVYDALPSGTQTSVVAHSPQAKREPFSLFHPRNRKALKHPGWRNIAAEAMGSTLVRTTRRDHSGKLRTSRIDQNWSLRAVTAIQ